MVRDIKTLSVDELMEALQRYPWYGAARKELCIKLSAGESPFAEAALYVPDRGALAALLREARRESYADKDVGQLLRPARRAVVIGGDYFSQEEYDRVRESGAPLHFAPRSAPAEPEPENSAPLDEEFCTEPLAQIFAAQGYYEEAIRIYSRLSLLNPEKSAYFASLIEKLKHLL